MKQESSESSQIRGLLAGLCTAGRQSLSESLIAFLKCLVNSWTCKWYCVCMCVFILIHVWLFATPWTPLSMRFPRQEYWSGLSFPSLGDLPSPGIAPSSLTAPALAGGFFTTRATQEACSVVRDLCSCAINGWASVEAKRRDHVAEVSGLGPSVSVTFSEGAELPWLRWTWLLAWATPDEGCVKGMQGLAQA